MTRGGIFRRGRSWWVRYHFKGTDVRESVCELLSVKRATKRDAQRVLAARLAQIAGELGAEVPGARLAPSERLLIRRTLEAQIRLAQSALRRLDGA